MEKFKEKKIAELLQNATVVLIIMCPVSIVLLIFVNTNFAYLLFVCFFGAVTATILGQLLSAKDKYTREFLSYIDTRIKNAYNIDDYKAILSEFESIAIEDKLFCLSFPQSLRYTHNRIKNSIEALERKDKQIL